MYYQADGNEKIEMTGKTGENLFPDSRKNPSSRIRYLGARFSKVLLT